MVDISLKPGIRVQAHSQPGSLTRIRLFSSSRLSLDTEFCDKAHIEALTAWLQAYANRKPIPFPLSHPKSFQGDVLRFLQTVPFGTVLSYQEVARAVGSPLAARAVGNICRGNLFPLLIPCHRVIRASGEMGQYTPDPSLKRKLLHFEGVEVLSKTGAVS